MAKKRKKGKRRAALVVVRAKKVGRYRKAKARLLGALPMPSMKGALTMAAGLIAARMAKAKGFQIPLVPEEAAAVAGAIVITALIGWRVTTTDVVVGLAIDGFVSESGILEKIGL